MNYYFCTTAAAISANADNLSAASFNGVVVRTEATKEGSITLSLNVVIAVAIVSDVTFSAFTASLAALTASVNTADVVLMLQILIT